MGKGRKAMTIEALEKAVRHHNQRYFEAAAPEISDAEFDLLVRELERRKPDSPVLAEVGSDLGAGGGRKRIEHSVPMLSLGKCYSPDEAADWVTKFEGEIVATPKIDGTAMAIRYDANGELVQAATRGNGWVGEEVTENVRQIAGVPKKVKAANIEVRGEVFMPLSVFARYKETFANPRNLAAGAIKQKDPAKTGEYTLSFFAYDVLGVDRASESEKFEYLKALGFPIPAYRTVTRENIEKTYHDFFQHRDDLDYETDGVVFKANVVAEQRRLGATAHHPRYAIAYKYQGDSGETTLVDVEWSVARTGVITPVGIVEPVRLSGASVTRVSLHNVGLMKKLGISYGAKVEMMRRGGVIPNVERVVTPGKKKVTIPTECPSCGYKTDERDDFLYCTNPAGCRHVAVGSIIHFVKVIECDGWGDKLIERLYDEGLMQDAADLYTLTVDELLPLDRMGEKLANKLIDQMNAKREIPFDIFLEALGISDLGSSVARILAERYGTLEALKKATTEELEQIHMIGGVIAENIVAGLRDHADLIKRLLGQIRIRPVEIVSGGPLHGQSFLFTGTMTSMDRKEAQKKVRELGGSAATTVSRALTYLVVGSAGKAGSKLDKVNALNAEGASIQVISEEAFGKIMSKK